MDDAQPEQSDPAQGRISETGQFPVQWVYFVGEPNSGEPVKIGYAMRPECRVRQIQNGYPYRVEVLAAFRGGLHEEYRLHQHLSALRLHGEWFERARPLVPLLGRLRGERGGRVDWEMHWVLEREVWVPPRKTKREPWVYRPSLEVLAQLGVVVGEAPKPPPEGRET